MSADNIKPKGKISPLVGIIAFVVIAASIFVLSGFLGKQARPHRYALVNECIGEPANGQFFVNICETDINLRYCARAISSEDNDVCRTERLAPGVGSETYYPTLRDLGDDFRDRDVWACEAPYQPDMVVTAHNSALFREGCRPADSAGGE
ncbi:hypothetical protein [Ponticaulis sp.]|uniref:hypothetical protein n=1 Tax=Ponticaulis sp. TaxID=2020902 RepID=UPI000B664143|nr:hypothetical protein [Ponticaulis sp.]MAI90382.1 hypothetical protein [Ponticaulis sp.]OUY00085.1 MAG: hypothetical protein CBB65_08080 [Hyphomonadaceae bacterium TMED5]|tara:strand:+ start:2495 stop:2944 length:450 start_codon:yes stop_codon:yes gene_type:complete